MSMAHGSGNQGNIPPPSLHFQAQVGHGQGAMHGHGHGHGALPQGQFPPQLQQAFAQFHAVNQQLAAQLAAIGNSPVLQGMQTNQHQVQQFQQPAIPQPSFQHLVAQQQQARANAGHHGVSGTPQQNVQGNTSNPSSNTGAPTLSDNGQNPAVSSPPNLANTNTIVRENHGPHGERWQMVIQSGPMNMNPNRSSQSTSPAPPSSPYAGANSPMQVSPASRATQLPRNPNTNAAVGRVPAPLQAGNGQPPTANVALLHLQSNISTIEAAMAGGNPLPESVFDQAREMLRGTLGLSQEQESWLRTRLNNLSSRAIQLRENLHQHLIRAAQERVASQRATQGADSSAVYVVSSPSGPHALLVSPSGLYTTPWQFPTLGVITPHSSTNHSPNVVTQAHSTGYANTEQQAQAEPAPAAQVQQEAPQQIDAAQAAQAQQQQQQQQVNQARDMNGILLPLGGHLWLLLRLFGFVYFFTAGAGWRRTILLGLIASLVFIAQTGIFRPVIQGLWDPVRRHAEGLVPLAGNEHPRIGAVGAGENANAAVTQPTSREPTPQEAAERILQERERRNVNLVRQTFRRAERAVALFVASLVPGVGERHIAAREAAEAARQAAAREREESARREEEVTRQQQEGEYSSGNGDADENGAGEDADTTTRRARDEVAQPPLVEV